MKCLWSVNLIVYTYRSGALIKNCESEVMELMRQIDLMMQSRKAEWDAQRQALQAKLEVREQEANVQGAMLEKKTHEV